MRLRKHPRRWRKPPHTLWNKERKAKYPLGCEVEANITSRAEHIKSGDRGFLIARRTKNNVMVLTVQFGSKYRNIVANAVTVVELNPQVRIKEQLDYYKAITGE
jgi:hypothetical protein